MLKFAEADLSELEIAAVVDVLKSGWIASGGKVKEFERRFATSLGASFAASCNSATSAALLLFEALGVGPGDEVVFPAMTFSGPAMMAHKLGADVVICDVDYLTGNMGVRNLYDCITERTKLVVPTHFAGAAVQDMREIIELCHGYEIMVVDDAAHAFPTQDEEGRMVGNQGTDATFFSFYATKTLTTGDGGMMVTDEEELADRLKIARSNGISRSSEDRYQNPNTGWHYDIGMSGGWKMNMTDISAALGIAQLTRAGHTQQRRMNIAKIYNDILGPSDMLIVPPNDPRQSWHLYSVRVQKRDEVYRAMLDKGVQCSVHFIPLHHHSFWKQNATALNCTEADRMAKHCLSLPIYPTMTDVQAVWVAEALLKVLGDLA